MTIPKQPRCPRCGWIANKLSGILHCDKCKWIEGEQNLPAPESDSLPTRYGPGFWIIRRVRKLAGAE